MYRTRYAHDHIPDTACVDHASLYELGVVILDVDRDSNRALHPPSAEATAFRSYAAVRLAEAIMVAPLDRA